MRKEWMSEPSLNIVESGNAEKALIQVRFNKREQKKEERTYSQLQMGIRGIVEICRSPKDLAQGQNRLKLMYKYTRYTVESVSNNCLWLAPKPSAAGALDFQHQM